MIKSALAHYADSSRTSPEVREVPEGDICSAANYTLFDDLVGAREHRRGDFNAECLGGLQVNDQLVFRRRLYRQVGRLFAFEDTVDVASGTAELVESIVTV